MTHRPGHAQRKHSEFSPSSAKRWMTCPGSVRLARSAPPQVESKYAKEGTDAHECLEFIVKRFSDVKAAAKEAAKRWPSEMIDHAVNSAEAIYALKPSPEASLLIEKRVVLKTISRNLYGTLDYAWVDHWGTLVIIDYKYGAGVTVLPVDENGEPNEQLMIYAYGVAAKHHFDFESVKLCIIQPRVWSDGDDPTTAAIISVKKLKDFAKKIDAAYRAASEPNAKLCAGEHCRWCPAAADCPENSKKALEDASMVFDIETGIQAAPNVLTLTPETLPKILKGCDALENWIDAVRARAFQMAEAGHKIPGYKLVPKRAQRVWLPEAEKVALEQFGSGIYEEKMLSPSKLEKQFGKRGKDFSAKFTAAVSSGVNLVPESNRKSEATPTNVWD